MSDFHAFGYTEILIATRNRLVGDALTHFVALIADSGRLPIRFNKGQKEQRHFQNGMEGLVERLSGLAQEALPYVLCLVDLTGQESTAWRISDLPGGTTPGAFEPAYLVLTFPEVYFLFLVDERNRPPSFGAEVLEYHVIELGDPSTEPENFARCLNLIERHAKGLRAWFDPTGLRAHCREELDAQATGKDAAPEKSLERSSGKSKAEEAKKDLAKPAVTVDEEADYLLSNGYLLYRQGLDVFLCPSDHELHRLFGHPRADRHEPLSDPIPEQNGSRTPSAFSFVLEDLELRFADAPTADTNSGANPYYPEASTNADESANDGKHACLTARAKRFGQFQLLTPNSRCVLSSSPPDPVDNQPYKTRTKPYRGFLDAELVRMVDEALKDQNVRRHDRLNKNTSCRDDGGTPRRHSAPGRAQLVANHLCTRAEAILAQKTSLESSFHSALLALDAAQSLRGRTMTLSIEAISLLHRAELLAECQFPGIAEALPIKKRILELREMLERVVNCSGGSATDHQTRQIRSEFIEILNHLRQILAAYGKLEEEEIVLHEIRRNVADSRRADAPARALLKPPSVAGWLAWLWDGLVWLWSCFVWGLSRYVIKLLTSPRFIILSSFFWVLLIATTWHWLVQPSVIETCISACPQSIPPDFWETLEGSIIAFVGPDPSPFLEQMEFRSLSESCSNHCAANACESSIFAWKHSRLFTFSRNAVLIESALGVSHLGIFIAWLYTYFSRR